MAYYSGEEDEVDIRFRRGRGPPAAPVRFVDPRARERLERLEARDRAAYYQAATGGLLLPNRAGPSAPRRSLSQGRSRQHQIPAAPPVIINNHIDNYYDEEVLEEDPRYHYGRQLVAAPQLQLQHHSRSRRRHSRHSSSHSRSSSSSYSSRHSHHHEHHELEKTRKELEKFKIKEKEAAEAHIRREEEELARLKAEQKRAKEAKERKEAEDKAIHEWHEKKAKEAKEKKEAEDRAIKEWQEREKARAAREKEEKDKIVAEFKKKEQEKAEREKKEKEEEEKRYKEKVEADMKKAGLTDAQIAAVLKKESKGKQIAVQERPTYTRMARRHISIETLRVHNIDFEFDVVSALFHILSFLLKNLTFFTY